jgi:hypothetical protein
VLSYIEKHVRAAIRQGEVRGDEDPETAAGLVVGVLRGVMLQRLVDEDVDLDAVRNRMLLAVDRMQVKPGARRGTQEETARPRTLAKARIAKPAR